MKAIVLCAGYGTRLGELTRDRPKALLTVGGRPLVTHVVDWLVAEGVDELLVNLHYHGEDLRRVVAEHAGDRVTCTFTEEPVLLGTAGTVRDNRAWLAGEDVLVVYGDVLTDQALAPLLERHTTAGADATIVVHRRANSNSAVTMDPDGRVRAFVERPDEPVPGGVETWVFSGIQVLSDRAVAAIPPGGPADLPRDLYAPAGGRLRLFGLPLSGRRVAVDSPERLAQADALFGGGRSAPPAQPPGGPSAQPGRAT